MVDWPSEGQKRLRLCQDHLFSGHRGSKLSNVYSATKRPHPTRARSYASTSASSRRPNSLAKTYSISFFVCPHSWRLFSVKWGNFCVRYAFNSYLLFRMGAMMGTGVGLTIGFIFGSWSIIRCVSWKLEKYGPRRPFSTEVVQVLVVPLQPCRNTCLVVLQHLASSLLSVQWVMH